MPCARTSQLFARRRKLFERKRGRAQPRNASFPQAGRLDAPTRTYMFTLPGAAYAISAALITCQSRGRCVMLSNLVGKETQPGVTQLCKDRASRLNHTYQHIQFTGRRGSNFSNHAHMLTGRGFRMPQLVWNVTQPGVTQQHFLPIGAAPTTHRTRRVSGWRLILAQELANKRSPSRYPCRKMSELVCVVSPLARSVQPRYLAALQQTCARQRELGNGPNSCV